MALLKAELVQSSSIFLGARPARRQDVQALRFRLTGPDIGGDYARLAPNGFSLVVEHVFAGQPRRMLFEASSLLELVESGSAQVLRNQRHLETTLEVSDLQANTKGWRQSETGKDVTWAAGIDPDIVRAPEDTPYLLPIVFRSHGTNETRIHTQQIGFVGDDKPTQMLQDQVKTLNELIQQVAGASNSEYVTIPKLAANPLFGSSATTSSFTWKGIDSDRVKNIQGLYHLNVPPFSLATQFATNVITLLQSYPEPPPAPELMQEFMRDVFLRTLLSGFSASVSLGYVLGGSISSGQLLPSVSRVATSGDTGTIQLQGTEAGYQFSRYLNTSYDGTRHVRKLVRKEEQRRRGGDVTWNGEYVDIVTGIIPIGIRLPASSSDVYRTTDEAIRVRFSAPPDSNVRVDVWFDVIEENAKHDH